MQTVETLIRRRMLIANYLLLMLFANYPLRVSKLNGQLVAIQ